MSLRTQTLDYIQYREEVLQSELKEEVNKLLSSGLSMKEVNQMESIKNLRLEYRSVKRLVREWEIV